MTSLAQTAIDFCRECMGWEDVKHSPTGAECVFSERAHVSKRLMYTDLNAVMEAAKSFCAGHQITLSLFYGDSAPAWAVDISRTTQFRTSFSSYQFAHVEHESLPHALLAACVEASRKMKGAV